MTIEDGADGCLFAAPSGEEVFVQRIGGAGPAVIICHATGFHGAAYKPMAAGLLDDFTVWTVDVRGHGQSPRPISGDFTWSVMAEDVRAVINDLTDDPVFAFGHSMGGSMLLLAELAQPGLLRAAYMFEPIVFPVGFSMAREVSLISEAARRRRRSFPSRSDAAWHYSRRHPLNQLRADALHAYVQSGFVDIPDGSVQLACDPDDEASTFECETKVTLDIVEGMVLPTVVAAGALGLAPSPATFAPLITDAIVGACLTVFEEMGHLGPLEFPDVMGSAVRSFFLEN